MAAVTTERPLVSAFSRWREEKIQRNLDRPLSSYYLLLGSAGLLLILGLMMVLSSSSVYSFEENGGNSYAIFIKQATWAVLGIVGAVLATRMPHTLLRRLAWPGMAIAVILLILTQTGLGVSVYGNQNWLQLGPITIQPSEFTKFAIILWTAHILACKEKLLADWRHIVVPIVPGVGLLMALVLLGRDLGTTLILAGILFGVLFVAGLPLKWFGGALALAGSAAIVLATTSEERQERLTTFADPLGHINDAGWQAAHGLFAMSTGGLFGKGIGHSQQKWGNLPAAHTDFIFAVLGEELGLVGSLLVLLLFFTLIFAGIRVAMRAQDTFVRFFACGIVVWLAIQMAINIAMVMAMAPVVGVPLPLVSYGGSSLMPTLVAVGFLVAFARMEPDAQTALAAKRKERRPLPVAAAGRQAKRRLGRGNRAQ